LLEIWEGVILEGIGAVGNIYYLINFGFGHPSLHPAFCMGKGETLIHRERKEDMIHNPDLRDKKKDYFIFEGTFPHMIISKIAD
jgi:hypothetical protein